MARARPVDPTLSDEHEVDDYQTGVQPGRFIETLSNHQEKV
ncbi:hypothetical protein I545_5891 [Mycobacterium kansasii 662]|uniref:Uncharacterized protein n=1 Tax=Mycobacterium kansasii 662 TaxID=1299326 RepID=X7YRH1_MYCKA|nr:hypothetical protein I545_5891 [Mycobacterium kansasii 662]